MAKYCTAGEDCTCPIWDSGKVRQICISNNCKHIGSTYILNTCDCGSKDRPSLYGQGIAKQYINEDGGKSDMFFTEFDGYVVECCECGAITGCYNTPEVAVQAWNKRILAYVGDSYL